MRKSRLTEAQTIGMIKEQEAGMAPTEVCRKHGLNPALFYKLKARCGGMDLSDARRLKQPGDDNARLKRLLADRMLDNLVLPRPQACTKAPVEKAGCSPWSADEIEAFCAHWPIGTVQRACFVLVFWTGTRTIGAVQLGRQHVGRNGLLVFRQSKTGRRMCRGPRPYPPIQRPGRPSATRCMRRWPACRAA